MTPKKVWGVIIIVLGILCFLNAAMICAEFESNTKTFKMLDQQLSIFDGKNTHTASNTYKKIAENEQSRGVTNSLFGIAMAIIGTLMLRGKKKKRILKDHKTNSTHSNEEPAVRTEPERDEPITSESHPPEQNEIANPADSIPINDKPQIQAVKIINMKNGKDD